MDERYPRRTPFFLMQALKEEVERITNDMRFMEPKNPGEDPEYVKMQVFEQALPIPEKNTRTDGAALETIDYLDGNTEDAVYNCPWAVIKVDAGKIPGINANQNVTVAVCFGIFNDSLENNGHQEILNLIQRVYERFAKDPILAGSYTCTCEFEWALQDEDTYPYYFGAIGMSFEFMGIRRENRFV